MIEVWVGVLGLTGVLASSIGLSWFNHWLGERKKRKMKERNVKAHADFISEAATMFREVRDLIGPASLVDRVLFLRGRNNGGVPMAGNPYYVEATYEDTADGTSRGVLLSKYSDFQADLQYFEMLESLIQTKDRVRLRVSEMPDCKLRRLYESEGVSYSEVYFLWLSPTYLYFVSVATKRGNSFGKDAAMLYQLERTIEKIRALYQRTYGD